MRSSWLLKAHLDSGPSIVLIKQILQPTSYPKEVDENIVNTRIERILIKTVRKPIKIF